MPERLQPADLELTEFLAKLVEDTFDSIIVSYNKQFEKISEIEECLAISEEEFAKTYVDEEDVNTKLEEFFGTDFAKTSIVTDVNLFLDRLNLLNIQAQVGKDILLKRRVSSALLDLIKLRLRQYIAFNRMKLLDKIAQRGVPTVLISGGEINAKIHLNTLQTEAAASLREKKAEFNPQSLSSLEGKTFVKDKINKGNLSAVKLYVNQVLQKPYGTKDEMAGSITIRFDVSNTVLRPQLSSPPWPAAEPHSGEMPILPKEENPYEQPTRPTESPADPPKPPEGETPNRPKEEKPDVPLPREPVPEPESPQDQEPIPPKEEKPDSPLPREPVPEPESPQDKEPTPPKEEKPDSPLPREPVPEPESPQDKEPTPPKEEKPDSPLPREPVPEPESPQGREPIPPKEEKPNSPLPRPKSDTKAPIPAYISPSKEPMRDAEALAKEIHLRMEFYMDSIRKYAGQMGLGRDAVTGEAIDAIQQLSQMAGDNAVPLNYRFSMSRDDMLIALPPDGNKRNYYIYALHGLTLAYLDKLASGNAQFKAGMSLFTLQETLKLYREIEGMDVTAIVAQWVESAQHWANPELIKILTQYFKLK